MLVADLKRQQPILAILPAGRGSLRETKVQICADDFDRPSLVIGQDCQTGRTYHIWDRALVKSGGDTLVEALYEIELMEDDYDD